jgi:flavin reductase (DIM6/NTAB) family NADH-FMN oxidoreductase RutF
MAAKTLTRQLRALVNAPRYGAVGLDDPQHDVEVCLRADGLERDVTRNNVVTSLRPFTIGIMFDATELARWGDRSVELCMQARGAPSQFLGSIQLRPVQTIALPEHRFCLFEVDGIRNRSVAPPNLALYYLAERWKLWRQQRKNPYNFRLTTLDLHGTYVFYICPRPVVLVTVQHEDAGNMFPMDLIGPTDSPWYSMALRKTSPAVQLMRESRRMALASVPLRYKDDVYRLGRHHKMKSIDWSQLPFATKPSPLFGFPVIDTAIRIREVRVEEACDVGSHALFLTRIEQESVMHGEKPPQLFHRFCSHREFIRTHRPDLSGSIRTS